MNFDFVKFFEPGYLFARAPFELSRQFAICWLVTAGVFMVASVGLRWWVKKQRTMLPAWGHWWRRLASALLTSGMFAIVLLFFRYERVPFLAARYLMVFWAVGTLAWIGYLLYLRVKKVPAIAATEAEDRRLKKYLP